MATFHMVGPTHEHTFLESGSGSGLVVVDSLQTAVWANLNFRLPFKKVDQAVTCALAH